MRKIPSFLVFGLTFTFTATAQAKLSIPSLEIKLVDQNKESIIIGQDNNLRGSLKISQDVQRSWKLFPIGSAGIFYPKKHIEEDVTLLFKHSDSRNSRIVKTKQRSVRTHKETNLFKMSFNVQRKASCTRSEKVILDLPLTTEFNGRETSCQQLFSFKGTKKQLQDKLNSLPSKITCHYDGIIKDFASEFKDLAIESIFYPENCKDWTTGKKIL